MVKLLNNDICEFYKKIFADEKLKSDLANKLKNISNDNELRELFENQIRPIAKKSGYDFTYEDLIDYEKNAQKLLDDEMLENISGGFSSGFKKFASVISLSMMGLNLFSPAMISSAAPPDGPQTQTVSSASDSKTRNRHRVRTKSEDQESQSIKPIFPERYKLKDNKNFDENSEEEFNSNQNEEEEALTIETTSDSLSDFSLNDENSGAELIDQENDEGEEQTVETIIDDHSVNEFRLNLSESSEAEQEEQTSEVNINSTRNQTIDLFENDNLDRCTLDIMDKVISTNESDANRYNHFKDILSNPEIMNSFINIKNCIENDSINLQAKRIHIISHFKSAEDAMKKSSLRHHQFLGFITSAKNAYEVIVSRELANQIIEDNRAEIEKKMGSESTSAEISIDFNVDTNSKFSVGFKASEGSSEKSFYRINKTGSLGGAFTVGIPKNIDISLSGKVELTQVLICRSLEQLLDNNSSATIYQRASQINDIAKLRKEMQENERDSLSSFKTSLEFYLKFLEVISQNASLVSPKITKTQTPNKERTIQASAELSADLKALAKAGIAAKVSAAASHSSTKVYHDYLNVINEDCSPSELGKSPEKIIDKFKTAKFPIVLSCKDHINSKQEILAFATSLKGYVSAYRQNLAILSNKYAMPKEKADAKIFKHTLEERWLPKNVTGRLNIFKAAIAAAVTLRTAYNDFNEEDDDETLILFEDIHYQISELGKLQTFTKSIMSSKKSANFPTEYTANSASVEGVVEYEIPKIGKSEIKISYGGTDSEFGDETCRDITFSVKLPVQEGYVVGKTALQKALTKLQQNCSESKHKNVRRIAEGIKLIIPKFDLEVNALGYGINEYIPEKPIKSAVQLTFEFTKPPGLGEGSKPLPGEQEVCKSPLNFTLKRVNGSEIKTINKDGIKLGLASAAIKGDIKRNSTVIGDNSLIFSTSKFNTFAKGLLDRIQQTETSELWTSFKNGQKNQLKGLFSNIATPGSNAHYELQCMYNDVLSYFNNGYEEDYYHENNKENLEKQRVDEVFSNFSNSCKDFLNDKSEENYNNASNLLDQILYLNYRYSYMPSWNSLHSL